VTLCLCVCVCVCMCDFFCVCVFVYDSFLYKNSILFLKEVDCSVCAAAAVLCVCIYTHTYMPTYMTTA
jgi:hypothetical protein